MSSLGPTYASPVQIAVAVLTVLRELNTTCTRFPVPGFLGVIKVVYIDVRAVFYIDFLDNK